MRCFSSKVTLVSVLNEYNEENDFDVTVNPKLICVQYKRSGHPVYNQQDKEIQNIKRGKITEYLL